MSEDGVWSENAPAQVPAWRINTGLSADGQMTVRGDSVESTPDGSLCITNGGALVLLLARTWWQAVRPISDDALAAEDAERKSRPATSRLRSLAQTRSRA